MGNIFTIDLLKDVEACHEAMKSLDANWSVPKLLNELGISYIGDVESSQKSVHSTHYGTKCYFIYLLAADGAGEYMDAGGLRRPLNVCPNSIHCAPSCLSESGRAGLDIRSEQYRIYRARLIKTKLFFERNDIFMKIVCHEIQTQRAKALLKGFEFACRLNGTSDIDYSKVPIKCSDGSLYNIFEYFPQVTFYDYTKIPQRLGLMSMYPNYKLTLSFNGYNENVCVEALHQGHSVAVVFNGANFPEKLWGYPVINGDLYDMRYYDRKFFGLPEDSGYIVGLKYKPVASDYVNGKFVKPKENKFIVETA